MLDLRLLEGEGLQLVLDALRLALLGLDASDGDVFGGERLEHALLFARKHKEQTVALGGVAGGSSDTVDVGVDVFGHVELDDPVDGGEVETTCGNVGGKEHGMLRLGELRKDLQRLACFCLPCNAMRLMPGRSLQKVSWTNCTWRHELIKTSALHLVCVRMKEKSRSSFFSSSTSM